MAAGNGISGIKFAEIRIHNVTFGFSGGHCALKIKYCIMKAKSLKPVNVVEK